jgi:hypothetical protein
MVGIFGIRFLRPKKAASGAYIISPNVEPGINHATFIAANTAGISCFSASP